MRSGCSALRRVTAALIVLTGVPFAPAQDQKSGEVRTGSIIGSVTSEDSKLPLRFVAIRLVPKPIDADTNPAKQPPASGLSDVKDLLRVNAVYGTSDMDGMFHMDGVPAGEYFVAAVKTGYVTPGASVDEHDTASEDELKTLISTLPTVQVAAGQTATLNLTLHRGGVIAGRMQFADGSPAIGMTVECEHAVDYWHRPDLRNRNLSPLEQTLRSTLQSLETSVPAMSGITDDEGRYRISALPPGKYIVATEFTLDHSAHVMASDERSTRISGQDRMSTEAIQVYQPGFFRRKDAKVYEIRGGEQFTDADLTINPDGLHRIRGRILDGADGHVPRHVTVGLSETGSNDQGRVIEVQDDGSFQFDDLPSGSYSLTAFANDGGGPQIGFFNDPSTDPDRLPDISPVREYTPAKRTVLVVDRDVVLENILLTALKPGEK
jgi:hypothetical protein